MISDHPIVPSARNLLGQFSESSLCLWGPLLGISHPLISSLCLFAAYPHLSLHLESSPVLHWSVFPPTQYFLDETWSCHINYYLFWFSLTPDLSYYLEWVWLLWCPDSSAAATWFFTRKKVWVVGCQPCAPWFLTLWFSDYTQGKDQDRIVPSSF